MPLRFMSETTAAPSRFLAWAAGDHEAMERLLAEQDPSRFEETCRELADAHRIPLQAGEIAAAVAASRRAWGQRHLPEPVVSGHSRPSARESALPPADWFPVHLHTHASPAVLEWARFGPRRLFDPFFEQSAGAALRAPGALLFPWRGTVDALEDEIGDAQPELAPAGFVFHLSRCGSTLLAQVLAASPRNRVLSEAPPIDQLLAHDAGIGLPRERRIRRLRAVVNAYARKRAGDESRLFIKWDAWHTLHLDLIQAAFPRTPWVYLHRDPVEILVSQRRQRGYQFLPGAMDPRPFGIAPEEIPACDLDRYTARVLGASAAAATRVLANPASPAFAVDFPDLRERIPGLLRHSFGLSDTDAQEWSAVQEALTRNAKNPRIPFSDDSEQKRREADETLRTLAETWLGESRRALLRHRNIADADTPGGADRHHSANA